MKFTGYIVGSKRFGCGQRREAEAYAKATGLKLSTWTYKV